MILSDLVGGFNTLEDQMVEMRALGRYGFEV
jgi:hypothetical protein